MTTKAKILDVIEDEKNDVCPQCGKRITTIVRPGDNRAEALARTCSGHASKREEYIRILVQNAVNNGLTNPDEYRKYLETKTDTALEGMAFINCF